MTKPKPLHDYSLTGKDSALAIEKGHAEAAWYTTPIPKEKMRELLERRDGPAIRDTLIWFALLFFFATAGFLLWGTWWAILPFAIYGVLYASSSDSRWHESSHGTAFKTDWMNNLLYEIASFMVLRESTPWRWSHTRHHSDTIIVGRDPEIAVPRPANLTIIILNFFNLPAFRKYLTTVFQHLQGRLTTEELTFTPESARKGIVVRAWIYLAIYASVIGLAILSRSLLPLMFIGLPSFYGAWLMVVYGYTQHAGLAENVLDHRLNCRTVYMNWINRYLYWNMGYHVEHHMFPLVPYHALPKLHELVKADFPTPYPDILNAYREIIPTILRQANDPAYFVKRKLPSPIKQAETAPTVEFFTGAGKTVVDGWIEVCTSSLLRKEDVVRFDHAGSTYAIYRTAEDQVFATEGICTHSSTHLAGGMLSGTLIECPKHNGRFDIRDGSPQRLPVCVALKTYSVVDRGGSILLDLNSAGGLGVTEPVETIYFRVVSNNFLTAFIKELVLELDPASQRLNFQPGDYMQFDIPPYPDRSLRELAIEQQFAHVWETQGYFKLVAGNPVTCRRNFSFASNPVDDRQFRFNVRIALPPPGLPVKAGVGSTYLFGMQPGETVSAIGPFGDFHIKNSGREMVYLGGGSGMAPLKSHISYLLETQQSERRISFWFGARTRQDIFYREEMESLALSHPNFTFHVALSEPQPGDDWTGHTGFIHAVLKQQFLELHPNPKQIDYYLCGPPAMIQAARSMLEALGVPTGQVAYDEF